MCEDRTASIRVVTTKFELCSRSMKDRHGTVARVLSIDLPLQNISNQSIECRKSSENKKSDSSMQRRNFQRLIKHLHKSEQML